MLDEITYLGSINPFDSYAIITFQTVLELERRGIRCYLAGEHNAAQRELALEHYPALAPILCRPKRKTEWAVVHASPPCLLDADSPRKILHTMTELSRVHADWAALANTAEALILPSEGQFPIWRDSGVTIPMYRVVDPIDVAAFTYYARPRRDVYRFLAFGTLASRKMPFETVAAFRTAFPTETDVTLTLKTQNNAFGMTRRPGTPRSSDPRITILNGSWPTADMARLCHEADGYIALSRGEGSFNAPVQAMATGMPVCGVTHSGCSVWTNEDCMYPIPLDPVRPYLDGAMYGWGNFYNPDMNCVVETMRHMVQHQEEGREKGRMAAQWVRQRFAIQNAINELLAVFQEVC